MKNPEVNPYEPSQSPEPETTYWKSLFRRRPKQNVEPQRLLDDIAHAVHRTRVHLIQRERTRWTLFSPRIKRRVVQSLALDDQFDPFSIEQFGSLFWKFVGCSAPSNSEGYTIQQVVDHIVDAGLLGDRVPAGLVTVQQWCNAQIFAGVQMLIIEQCGIAKDEIYRQAHFVEDLNCC